LTAGRLSGYLSPPRHTKKNGDVTVRKLIILSLAFFVLGLTATTASAAKLKVGVVDVQYVVLKSKRGQAAKGKLKRIFQRKQKALNKQQEDLLKLKKRLEAPPSAVSTPDRRKKMVVAYQQGLAKLQEAFVQHQKFLAQEERKLMKPIFKRLESILNAVAKAGGYDLILSRGQDGVLFRKDAMDITKTVLTKLNGS
jgi:Skp family chaperone for outer membrane proteins